MRRYDAELLASREAMVKIEPDELESHRIATREAMQRFVRDSNDSVESKVVTLPAEGGSLPVRVHSPRTDVTGGLLWLHGGAFSLGDPHMDDDICQDIAARHRLLVVAPAYRLAPEHPFPAAELDCQFALDWLQRRVVESVAGGESRLVIAGASAGGALALRTALQAIAGGVEIDRLLLAYPVVDPHQSSSSMRRYSSAPVFDAGQAKLMWHRYLAGGSGDSWPSPLQDTRLRLLPLTLVLLAEHDPLRDEGLDLVKALLNSGVSVHARLAAGTYHAYDRFAPDSLAAEHFRRDMDEFLSQPRLVAANW